jgi:hypothetical protein
MFMERGESRCKDQLTDLRKALGMASNGDALQAMQGLLQLLTRSQNSTITGAIRQALCLTEIWERKSIFRIAEGADRTTVKKTVNK